MKTVILAEKPAQAKAYAESFQQRTKKEGCFEIVDPLFTGETIITYGFGHLVALVSPEHYDEKWGKWSLDTLPIFPKEVAYEVPEDKKKQFDIVKKQLQSADTIVIATDPDREGEAIAWSIIHQADAYTADKEYKRLWINSLEKQAIYQGFKTLRPGKEYYPKYKEAQARQIADWLVGFNGSPLYSLLLQKKGVQGSFSFGRVQTPTLFMIYALQEKIRLFQKTPYVEGKATVQSDQGTFTAKLTPNPSFKTKEELAYYLQEKGGKLGEQTGQISSVTKEKKSSPSPRLFSLSSLQTQMNKQVKASAQETLEAMQGLYEAKWLSYPRTDATYITENEFAYLREHLEEYKAFLGVPDLLTPNQTSNPRYVNPKKVQEHHSIIPTKSLPTDAKFKQLSALQQAIYQEIVRTTVAMFAEKYVYEETIIETTIQQLKVKASGKVPVTQGWKTLFVSQEKEVSKEKKVGETSEQLLPKVTEGDVVSVAFHANEKVTKPPKPFTEGTLITAMKTAGKAIDDEQAQTILKEVEGIGTEATRAGIIESLKRRELIVIKKNQVVVTAKGVILCKAVQAVGFLSSVEMTANWESYLKKIGDSQGTQEIFLEKVKKFIVYLLENVPNQLASMDFTQEQKVYMEELAAKGDNQVVGICPKCGQMPVKRYKKVAKCMNQECGFKLWTTVAQKDLSQTILQELVTSRRTKKAVKGFEGKKGPFDAFLVLTKENVVQFEFPKKRKTTKKGKKETNATAKKI